MPPRPSTRPPPEFELAARGNRSTLVTQALRLGCKAVSVLIMARLIPPADYGLFAMAASFVFLLALFRDGGLGTAAVQAHALDDGQLATLCWIHLALGGLLALVTVALAPLAAWFYATPAVSPLLATMSLSFLLIGAGGFARSQLAREMRFQEANRLETVGAVTGTIAMIAAGAAGAGPYAFVIFLLVSEGVNTALAWLAFRRLPRGRFQFSSIHPLIRTGLDLTAYQVLSYVLQQIDTFVVGRSLGARILGLYNRSAQLLALGTQHVTVPLAQVTLAALSRLGANSPQFITHACAAVTAIAHFSLPLATVSLAIPDETVRLVLGGQWSEAAMILRWLALSAAVNTLTSLAYGVNVAAGQTRRLLLSVLLALPVTALAIVASVRYGAVAVAASLAAANVVLAGPRLWWMLRGSPVPIREFGSALAGPLAANTALAIGLIVGRVCMAGAAWPMRLAAALLGGIVAVGLLAALWPRLRREGIELLAHLPWRPERQT